MLLAAGYVAAEMILQQTCRWMVGNVYSFIYLKVK